MLTGVLLLSVCPFCNTSVFAWAAAAGPLCGDVFGKWGAAACGGTRVAVSPKSVMQSRKGIPSRRESVESAPSWAESTSKTHSFQLVVSPKPRVLAQWSEKRRGFRAPCNPCRVHPTELLLQHPWWGLPCLLSLLWTRIQVSLSPEKYPVLYEMLAGVFLEGQSPTPISLEWLWNRIGMLT